jgi:hypothetical protein
VCLNLTLSVDEKVVERAREVASRQGTSLQALIRQYLEALAGSPEGSLRDRLEEQWREGDRLLRANPARIDKLDRDALDEERVGRRRGE